METAGGTDRIFVVCDIGDGSSFVCGSTKLRAIPKAVLIELSEQFTGLEARCD